MGKKVPRSRSTEVIRRPSCANTDGDCPNARRTENAAPSMDLIPSTMTIEEPRFAFTSAVRLSVFPLVPRIAKRMASARVDFPLPRGPITQVRPGGKEMFRPAKKPPVISVVWMIQCAICATCSNWGKCQCSSRLPTSYPNLDPCLLAVEPVQARNRASLNEACWTGHTDLHPAIIGLSPLRQRFRVVCLFRPSVLLARVQ